MNLRFLKIFLMFWICLSSITLVWADEVHIAVGDQFLPTLQKLVLVFEKDSGHKTLVTASSVGVIYNKLKDGANFDVFLSADTVTPIKIEEDGLAVANSRFSYAVGKLVLWSPNPNLVDKNGEILKTTNFKHIAIPHTERAPYGVVAKQVLQKLGLWDGLQSKIIISESPVTTYKLIVDGGAELGFVPLAMLNPTKKIEGSLWIVPLSLYPRFEHQAVLLKHGENNKAARDFMVFLKSTRARNIIESFGYILPE